MVQWHSFVQAGGEGKGWLHRVLGEGDGGHGVEQGVLCSIWLLFGWYQAGAEPEQGSV